MCPTACTASVWKATPRSRQRRAISATGWIAPTSLFAHITDTTLAGSSRASSSASRATRPSASTATVVTAAPSRAAWAAARRTALCSMADRTTPPPPARHRPSTAMLSASVPLAVNTISSGAAPSAAATRSRASSSAARASRPAACALDGLPNRSPRNGSMAARTAGRSGVVAAWSRYRMGSVMSGA